MKRKHVPGCYCCAEQTCYTLQESDLPTVSLAGWTSTEWAGNACCKCVTLTPNSKSITVNCSGDYATANIDISCEWNLRALTRPKPLSFSSLTCPIPSDSCCSGPIINIGSGESLEYRHFNYRILFKYSPAKIDVCISKQDVDCGGVVSQKYVVVSKYCYDVEVYSVRGYNISTDSTITVTNDCFAKLSVFQNPGFCDSLFNLSREAPCDIEEVDPEKGDALVFSGQACFQRVKFFDDTPSGNISFGNADDGDGCAWSFCEANFEYATDYCYQVSSFVNRPCWCNHGWTLTEQTTTTDVQSNCGCDVCNETLQPGTNYLRVISCDPYEDSLECCPGGSCSTCYSYQTTCFNSEWSATPEDNCEVTGIGYYCGSLCSSLNCVRLKRFDESADCYYSSPCGPSFASPKYSVVGNSAISSNWTIECNYIGPAEFCIFAPTWSLTFS